VFDAGALEYDQLVGNISAVRQVEMSALASPLNVAMGLEARREGYRIDAGEPQSYLNGGVLLPSGARAASGSQVFPGFQPSNEVDEDRTAVGAYIDLEANLTEKLLVSGALRAESYSDFGESVTGKIAGRYDFSDGFAIRGAVSTGFRAPGLQQSFFTATSTNFISGVPFDIVTTPAESAIARTLGAKPLDAEESTNYSLGLVARSGPFNLTVDAYFIEVTDRIVLTENLTQANVLALLPPGIGGVRFFQNGVDTETAGVDIVASYKVSTDTVGDFDFTAGLNFNNTVITRLPSINTLSALTPPPVLFARVNSLVLEKGQPKEKASFATVWSNGALGATARLTYYGSVVEPGTTPANDISLGQKSIFDVEGRVNLGESVQFALGAENLFDQYPDANPATLNTTGSTSFSNFSPFGYNGRYVYARASFSW
jgi:iron complex outermembrane receptor protein